MSASIPSNQFSAKATLPPYLGENQKRTTHGSMGLRDIVDITFEVVDSIPIVGHILSLIKRVFRVFTKEVFLGGDQKEAHERKSQALSNQKALETSCKRAKKASQKITAETPHFDYSLNSEEEEIIKTLITEIACSSALGLAGKARKLIDLGKKINHIDPFSFLACIFRKHQFKNEMKIIYDNFFKWRGFMGGGIIDNLNREAEKECFDHKLKGFASHLGGNIEGFQKYAADRDWKKFVHHAIFLESRVG